MTTKEVAQYLGISEYCVYSLAYSGKLKYRKEGKRNLYLKSDVENYKKIKYFDSL